MVQTRNKDDRNRCPSGNRRLNYPEETKSRNTEARGGLLMLLASTGHFASSTWFLSNTEYSLALRDLHDFSIARPETSKQRATLPHVPNLLCIPTTLQREQNMPYFNITKDDELYYEVKGEGERKMVMIMGFAATLRGYDSMVEDLLADGRYQVLTFDNRGCGKSKSKRKEAQTTHLLARDTLELIKHVGWESEPVHVYGASMGGMIAQELMFFLLARKQLASCYLAVTAGHRYPFRVPFGEGVYKVLLKPMTMMDRVKLVQMTLPMLYSKEYLDTVEEETGKMTGCRLYRELLDTWDTHMDFSLANIAAQSPACAKHWLSEERAQKLVKSGVPITCQVSLDDEAMPTKYQVQLSLMLKAHQVSMRGKHMEGRRYPELVLGELLALHERGILFAQKSN